MNNKLEASKPIDIKKNHNYRTRSTSLTNSFFEHSNASFSFGSYNSFKSNKTKWMQDDMVNNCTACETKFSWYYRKHHCRICQNIFCSNCLKHVEVIDINSYIQNIPSSNYKKVCCSCSRSNSRLFFSKSIIKILVLNKYLNIIDIQKFVYVNKLFRAASKFIIKQWEALSRKVDFQISILEQLLLEQNIIYCKKHPVLLSIYYYNKDKFQHQNINFLKSYNCSITNCGNRCKTNKKQIFNLILLLTYVPRTDTIFKQALHQLSQLNIHKIKIILTLLLQISDSKPEILNSLQKFENKLSNYIYFFYKYILKKPFLNYKKQYKLIDDFFSISLCFICRKIRKNQVISSVEELYLNDILKKNNIVFPFSNIILKQIDFNSFNIINSSSQPVSFNATIIKDNIEYQTKVIFKFDTNVINDFFIQELQRYLINLFKIEGITYYVFPMDNFAIIICNKSSCTLKNIKINYNNSLMQYFVYENSNKNKPLNYFLNNIAKTCSLQACIQLLLSLGDRHLDNTLINTEGQIFHIDFEYILQHPSFSIKLILLNNQSILFTSSILNLIGNNNSEYFKVLLEETKRITTIIKSEIQIVILFLYPLLHSNNFSKIDLINHIESFLLGGEKNSKGIDILLKKSTSTSADCRLLDLFSQAQDSGTAILKTLNNTNNALSLLNKIKFVLSFF